MAEPFADNYFNSYADLSVHALMIKDRPRTVAYRSFFESNRDFVKDKVVLDVGAGTGILSLFAATAGARKVYAVEACCIADLCKEIVEENHLEHIIQVIHGTVEEITLPEKVDIIVSEWMGFYLLHESMLDSVIVARDKFLAPGGIMVPAYATLYIAPVDLSDHFQERAEDWSNVYGFDFSPVASQLNMEDVCKPLIKCIDSSALKAEPRPVFTLDLRIVTVNDVCNISSLLHFPMNKESKIFGFTAWFNVYFSTSSDPLTCKAREEKCKDAGCMAGSSQDKITMEESVEGGGESRALPKYNIPLDKFPALKTGPWDQPTHWKQTTILLPQAILVDSFSEIYCRLNMEQSSENKRHYNITLCLEGGGCKSEAGPEELEDPTDPDFDDRTEHPVPCHCGSDRCFLIATLMNRLEEDEKVMQDEADSIQQEVQEEAELQLNAELTDLDTSKSTQSLEEDSG